MTNGILNRVKEKINTVSDTLNFVIPANKVIQYQAAKHGPKQISWDDHAGIYIGKMLSEAELEDSDIETIYNDSTLTGMLDFAHQQDPTGIIHIYIGPMLYDVLVDTSMRQQSLSPDMQKEKIYQLAKKAKVARKNIIIHSLDENHKELFDRLKNIGLESFSESLSHIKNLDKNTTSEYITGFFYTLCQKYPILKTKFFELAPENLQNVLEENDNLLYYGMIECAIRIKDLINGISTQGGIIRQKKYDDMIIWLLSGGTDIAEIDSFFATEGENLLNTFSRWYFKNDTYKKLLPKEEKRTNLTKKIRNSILISTGLIAAALSGSIGTYNFMKKLEDEKKNKEDIEFFGETLQGEKVGMGYHNHIDYSSWENNEKKVELINNATNRVYNLFSNRYPIAPEHTDAIKAIIKNDLLKKDEYGNLYINDVNRDIDIRRNSNTYYFIENQLIPNNKVALQTLDCKTDLAYDSWYKYYYKAFINTLNIDTKKLSLTVDRPGYSSNIQSGMIGSESSSFKDLGLYRSKSGVEYELAAFRQGTNRQQASKGTEDRHEYIVGRIATYDLYEQPYEYKIGQEIAKEILTLWEEQQE